jgi:hypothetical protein
MGSFNFLGHSFVCLIVFNPNYKKIKVLVSCSFAILLLAIFYSYVLLMVLDVNRIYIMVRIFLV